MSSSDPRQQFVAAMKAHGLALSGPLNADGRIHPCDVTGKGARGKDDGRYLLNDHDKWAAGGFQDWTSGRGWQKWSYRKQGWQPTAAGQREIDEAIEQAKSEAAKHLAEARAEARVKARRMWDNAREASAGHRYCAGKQLKPVGLRTLKFKDGTIALLVPLYDENERLQSLQLIYVDGRKIFLKGSRTRCGHFWVNAPPGDSTKSLTICVAEGWATGESIYLATGYPVVIAFSADNLRAVAEWLRAKYPDAKIIVCADDDWRTKSNPGVTAANDAARAVGGLVAVPGFGEDRQDQDTDFCDLMIGRGLDAVRGDIDAAAEPADGADGADGDSGACANGETAKQSDRLVQLAAEAELFHTSDGAAFADIRINGRRETWPIASSGFREWLTRAYYRATKSAPNPTALATALAVVTAAAKFDGPTREVFLRVAGHDGKIYLDLCDDAWRVIEIDGDGWRLVDDPPVRFMCRKGMKALPVPVNGKAGTLQRYVNVKDRARFILVLAWLLAALNPRGPYPVLGVIGEQGTAKSTLLKLLRGLIDPNIAPLRGPPREERDLHITAGNAWVLTYDNLSWLPDWLSDGLARLATEGAFATRQLWTDDEERLFNATRPIMLGSIEQVVKKGDLAERIIALVLEPIADKKRRRERELWQAFERDRPGILGGLLTAVSHGLKRLPDIASDAAPRMADFFDWAIACGDGLLWRNGEFSTAYAANRASVTAEVVEADAVTNAIQVFMNHPTTPNPWSGTASQLLAELERTVGERTARSKNWPSTASAFGQRFNRYTTPLRRSGIEIIHGERQGRTRDRIITIRKGEAPENLSAPSAPSAPPIHEQKTLDKTMAYLARTERTMRTGICRQPVLPSAALSASLSLIAAIGNDYWGEGGLEMRSSPRNYERTAIRPDEILALLNLIERHRRQADKAWRTFQDWLDGSPELAQAWHAFTAAGGLTGNEFMSFLEGRFCPRRIRRKQHLRLIASAPKHAMRQRNDRT